MTEIDKITKEVLPKTEVYFDSIEDQFRYREKNAWKFNVFNAFFAFSIVTLVLTYLPIIPYSLGEWEWLVDQTISLKIFEVRLDNFFIRWILLSAITSFLFF